MKSSNLVQEAIVTIGGATKAANIFQVANSTIYTWIRSGRVSDIDKARLLASLSGLKLEEVRP